MAQVKIKEMDLYEPVKNYLEGQGYEVKGEVLAADIVAMRDHECPVIVELKTAFNLTLFHQAVERQTITDHVYIAVPRGTGRAFIKALNANKKLCRLLGLGLISVRMKDGFVEAHLDPAPYAPRKSKHKQARLLREFSRRVGDPNTGGSTKTKMMTAYRQDALRCLKMLNDNGPTKASRVAEQTGVDRARAIMSADHYGWFQRQSVGIYAITAKGEEAMKENAKHIAIL